MSITRKAGLIIGVIGAATTVAATVEAGEGNGRKRYRDSPVYIVQPPPVVYAPAPTYYEPMYPRYDRYPSSPSVNINIPLR